MAVGHDRERQIQYIQQVLKCRVGYGRTKEFGVWKRSGHKRARYQYKIGAEEVAETEMREKESMKRRLEQAENR